MKSSSFDQLGGLMATLAAVAGFLYAVSSVVLKSQLLYSAFLTLLGLFAFAVLIAVYYRVRETDGAYALLAAAIRLGWRGRHSDSRWL